MWKLGISVAGSCGTYTCGSNADCSEVNGDALAGMQNCVHVPSRADIAVASEE